jgi:hypothetical protein
LGGDKWATKVQELIAAWLEIKTTAVMTGCDRQSKVCFITVLVWFGLLQLH